MTVYSLEAQHGDDLDADDLTALLVIRRTLLGLVGHGSIADLETYSSSERTQWSYGPGTEDGGLVMAGLLDVVRTIAPNHWVLISTQSEEPTMDEVIFVMACKNGHRIELSNEEARSRNMTPCSICHKPLTLQEVRSDVDRWPMTTEAEKEK